MRPKCEKMWDAEMLEAWYKKCKTYDNDCYPGMAPITKWEQLGWEMILKHQS
jgi:5,10-methylenetetrahydrofolate reductase